MLRVFLQHSSDEQLRTWWHVIWNHQVIICNLLVQVLVILPPIREASAEEGKEEDTGGVDVSRRPAELNLFDDFWGHVRRRTTEELDFLSVGDLGAETKVDEFDVTSVI